MKFHNKPYTFVELVELKVTNLENSLTFYQEVVGFKVLEKTATKALLTADGQTALLSIEQPTDIIPTHQKTTGLYHFALLLPTREDLGAVLRHFAETNIRIGAGDHLVSEALYLNDPDGNGIEIYSDRPDTEWTWKDGYVGMDTLQIDAQSILEAGANTQWNGLPEGTVMGHIHLSVKELVETEKFFNALGLQVVTPYPGALFMASGKYHHHVGLNTWNGVGALAPAENVVGLKAFTLVFPSTEELNAAIDQLKAIEVEVIQEDGIFTTKDPSQNKIKMIVK
ncbi:catechol 2,3-dioxygenase [Psychrobacillus insolitus]|uniref:Catechol 2,3-dioxygenase n=1 Tax=Psychrobacillus insolitus TaxID=1461 RepID=A0A2W7NCR5_9BACI|nr:VOC family protein [Psychrobacillus insolitus]PZX08239.1 catechol 2,3-dioxygenase [Psychrobacillus insolitus]